MEETNHIEKAIKYLQSLKRQGAFVESINIDYGYRIAEPFDKNYCEFVETKVSDGSFLITIQGKETK